LIAAFYLSACSIFPGIGPSRESIAQTGTWETETEDRPFFVVLVEVTFLDKPERHGGALCKRRVVD
jgi:hypothetical protein